MAINISMREKTIAMLLISLIVLLYSLAINGKKKLENSFTVTTAEIQTTFISSKNSNVLVRYTFEVNGKIFSGISNSGCSDYEYYSFLNELLPTKSLTVVFEKTNPKNSEMLFSTNDFKRFKLNIPNNQKQVVKIIDSLLKVK